MNEIKIVESSESFDKVELYKRTLAKNTLTMKTLSEVGESKSYILYDVLDTESGEVKRLLSVETQLGIYITQSKTFIDSYFEIVSLLESPSFNFKVLHCKGKNGREYIDCSLES